VQKRAEVDVKRGKLYLVQL